MCRSELFTLEVLAELKAAAPKPTETPPAEARLILAGIGALTDPFHQRMGMDDQAYYLASLASIIEAVGKPLSPKRAGLLCRAMGLTLFRRGTGYVVCWNERQTQILEKALLNVG